MVDLFEFDESFAVQPLAVIRELRIDPNRVGPSNQTTFLVDLTGFCFVLLGQR